jgi:Putative MetA-pathway of phenol degradation
MKRILALIWFFLNAAYAFEKVCDDRSLINLSDRPTFAYGACVLKKNESILEFGAKHFKLLGEGESNLLPDAEYRLGLGFNTELDVNPPDYFSQTVNPQAGFGYVSVGLKTLFYQTSDFVFSAEGFYIPPSGHAYFGARSSQGGFNLISQYNFKEKWSLALVFGAASYGEMNKIEFQNYKTYSPDLALSYEINNQLVVYGEFFGQTRSSYNKGFGLIFDTGLIYQIFEFATVDIEFGQRVLGELNNAAHYIGIGGVIRLD